MNVTNTVVDRQEGEAYTLIQQATRRLEEILGVSSGLVTVRWDQLAEKPGRNLYRLTLKDFTGQVSTEFAPEELQNPMHMQVRLYRLWGDLLQHRSDEQHKHVQTMIDQIGFGQGGD